ncbi:MAG: metalloregulator ArsR/SmtB family transcription factor [Acidimicrobiales bacterium]
MNFVTQDSAASRLIDDVCCPPVLDAALAENDAIEFASILKALADPIRLRLVSIIASAGEGCACDLPAAIDRSQPTTSHHLTQLVNAGILDREQRGKWAWFRVNEHRLAAICEALGGTSCLQPIRSSNG